jgi:selT/selW/selH-like putative selenoprotein
MAVTPERFAQGLTYADYKAQMTRNQEQFASNERAVELAPSDRAFFEGLDRRLNVLVIAEDWCGDVINNLPVLGRIAETNDQIDVRVFLRDQNLDIMDQYLKDGEFRSIPVFVVFDDQWNEVGYFIERPASVTARNEAFLADLYANDPVMSKYDPATPVGELLDDVRQHLQNARGRFRDQNRGFANQEVVREVRALFAKAVNGAADEQATSEGAGQFTASEATVAQTVDVRITYCAECGYEPQTLALTGDLMREFVHGLGSITLIPWHDGAFDVMVGGELVHSMYRDGGFPTSDRIIAAVRSRLGQ